MAGLDHSNHFAPTATPQWPFRRWPAVALSIALLTLSDRRSLIDDPCGDALQQRLEAAGHRLQQRCRVPDDRDGASEAVAPQLDTTMDGFGELLGMPGSLDAVLTAWDRLIAAQLDAETLPCNLVQLLPRLREDPGQPA